MIPRNLSRIVSTTFAAATIVAMLAVPVSAGSKGRVLYAFGEHGFLDGEVQGNLILDAVGNIYGTASQAGSCEIFPPCGDVFKLTRGPEGKWSKIEVDPWYAYFGSLPIAGVIFDSAGNLYGTASEGGDINCGQGYLIGCGTVFKLTPTSAIQWAATILHNFEAGTDGQTPNGALVFDSTGNLYGTTYIGGSGTNCGPLGCGTVFKLKPNSDGSWS